MHAPDPRTIVLPMHIPPAPPVTPEPPMLLAATGWRADLRPTPQPPRWLLRTSLAALALAAIFFGAALAQVVAQ